VNEYSLPEEIREKNGLTSIQNIPFHKSKTCPSRCTLSIKWR